MFRDLLFFITEALIGMRRSGIMIFISVATITVSLIVFGIFLLISANINNITNFITSKLEIRLYLKENITPQQIDELRSRLTQMKTVKSVTFIDKKTAWDKFQKNFHSMDLSDLLSENPLPDSFQIYLFDTSQIPSVANYLKGFEAVEDVSFMGVLTERIQLFSKFTKIAGIVLVGLLGVATLFITVNTIRLTVIARQEEITIMHLVGATHTFIRWPFIIEGMIMGGTGSVIAIIFLKVSYYIFTIKFQDSIPYFPLVYDSLTLNSIYLVVGLVGTSLGVLGAHISVSKTLKTTL